jgi:hypothetical protein
LKLLKRFFLEQSDYFFIGCIWFNTPRLCRGSKFKNICKIGIKADAIKNFLSNDSPFSATTKYTKAEKG